MPSPKLADELRRHDLFITASVSDPCSNSLIEAMHCGLPAVVKNSGGHPEILGNGGELFNGPEDIIRKIEKVSDNLYDYSKNISVPNMNEISQKYYSFCENIYITVQKGHYYVKKINYFDYIKLRMKTLA
jgi:glycosyltransferase involved in cell wall biosynthesis